MSALKLLVLYLLQPQEESRTGSADRSMPSLPACQRDRPGCDRGIFTHPFPPSNAPFGIEPVTRCDPLQPNLRP